MRLLATLLIAAFITGLLVFLYYNSETTVPIALGNTLYPQVRVFVVVVVTALAAILFVGIVAVAEGANIRLANRRLRKEISQLETEINYLRTQPASRGAAERTGGERGESPGEAEGGGKTATPPSAPVYGTGEDWPADDDDMYSGGRAV